MDDQNFSIASEKDDFDLKKCLRSIPMEGSISIAFETEPSYFNAITVQGKKQQVVICKDENQLVGFGTIAVKPVFLNGKIVEIGYLSGLRGYPQYRKGTFLARAYKSLKKLIKENNLSFCLTTIIEDNLVARKILESGRAGLPNYNFFGNFSTFLIKPRKKIQGNGLEIVKGNKRPLEEIIEFMNTNGSKKQFYPYIEEKDFGSDYLRGLSQENFYVALNGSEIIGLVAKWDQESFKQTRVVGYDRKIRFARPFINLASRFTNVPRLPSEGELLHYFYVSFPVVVLVLGRIQSCSFS